MEKKILKVAVPSPLWTSFDYLMDDRTAENFQPGMRVMVPFGRRQLLGVILALSDNSDLPFTKLKTITSTLDLQPLISASILKLLQWASDYYHYPIGEVVFSSLPKLLRLGKNPENIFSKELIISEFGKEYLQKNKRTSRQKNILNFLNDFNGAVSIEKLLAHGFQKKDLNTLIKKELVSLQSKTQTIWQTNTIAEHTLNHEQQLAVDAIKKTQKFKTFLLAGITGSGKTEVYLQAIAAVLAQQKQALVLVPEIALTPQTLARFHARFNAPIVVLHSGLSQTERALAWLSASRGEAAIIIGTRSATFTPMKNPGIIILDEEHDNSFKQQAGFRYSARDLLVMRAHLENIPIILGSATPSLESFYNVMRERYALLSLPNRAGNAVLPKINIIDLRQKKLTEGLSSELISAMRSHLNQGKQVLLFLNRRGFAPTLMCHHCGWVVLCSHCDTRLTLHTKPRQLHCHHCGYQQSPPRICQKCQQQELQALGLGTERLEQWLQQQFSDYPIFRIDRDSTRGKNKLTELFAEIHQQKACILVGTQLLAKGHHLDQLSLVAIVDADSGLLSADFRANEKTAQLLIQVAGRAGRSETAGEVYIQTYHPEHTIFPLLIKHDYFAAAESLLTERKKMGLPPYGYLALFRAESTSKELAHRFLEDIKLWLKKQANPQTQILGPIPAILEKKADHYRIQLLLQAAQRPQLQAILKKLVSHLTKQKNNPKIRWFLDIDPIEGC